MLDEQALKPQTLGVRAKQRGLLLDEGSQQPSNVLGGLAHTAGRQASTADSVVRSSTATASALR